MGSVTVARTIVCPLQTSQWKRQYLQTAIEEYQDCLETMAAVMPSVESHKREPQSSTISRLADKECSCNVLYAHDRNDAAYKVAEAFSSKASNGHGGELPSFGDDNYIRCCSCCGREDIVANDSGFGLQLKVQKGYGEGRGSDPVWFHIGGGEYQYEALDEIVDGHATLGNIEIHCPDDGPVNVHISYTRECVVPDGADVPRYVGVDLGERTLYALAVREADGDVLDVEVQSGDEQRHHRERLLERQQRRQQAGNQQRATGVSDRERYTEQVMHTASREIVDLAAEYAPCGIVLEDLTDYRESAQNPIHDWPYGMLQEQITYKAKAAQVPVTTVDPEYTSLTCRKCGVINKQSRKGIEFDCVNCGYQVNADVNAAMNLAAMGDDASWS